MGKSSGNLPRKGFPQKQASPRSVAPSSSRVSRNQEPLNVRTRKEQTLLGTLIGVLLGIVLILASPFVLWKAEGQNRAKFFESAEEVDVDSMQSGYITFQGPVEAAETLTCVNGENCLYFHLENQELKAVREEQCGQVSSDAEILSTSGKICDADGSNCETCYQVERLVWTTVSESEDYNVAQVGNYTVEFNDTALMLGLEEEIITHSDSSRDVWTYFPIPEELRVAGDAENQELDSAETLYVLSAYDQEETLAQLEEKDSTNKWLFRGLTFLMLFIGFSAIFGPLSYLSHWLRKIPLIGQFINETTKALITLVSLLLALITFLILWLIVMFIKNIFIIIGILAVGLLVFFLILNRRESAQVK